MSDKQKQICLNYIFSEWNKDVYKVIKNLVKGTKYY